MSDTNYLFIKNLQATVSPALVHPKMRDAFIQIKDQFQVTATVQSTGTAPADPLKGKFLTPIAYNLIVDALEDPELLEKLKVIGRRSGYWFFNIFIVPKTTQFSIPESLPCQISNGMTRGIDKTL